MWNSLLSADMDFKECEQKSTYFAMEKQKRKKANKNARKSDTV